jgi:hypothetical protein
MREGRSFVDIFHAPSPPPGHRQVEARIKPESRPGPEAPRLVFTENRDKLTRTQTKNMVAKPNYCPEKSCANRPIPMVELACCTDADSLRLQDFPLSRFVPDQDFCLPGTLT